jgi:hypothetical protein
MLRKSLIAVAAGAALLSGCATYPDYYDGSYAYNDGYYDRPAYRYYGAVPPSYYYPRYYGPPVGLSFGYSYHRYR